MTQLSLDDAQQVNLLGNLTLDVVPQILAKGKQVIDTQHSPLRFDFQQVARSDSAGVAMVLAWLRYAKQKNKALEFINFPQQMRAIAAASHLEQYLPITEG